MINRTIAHYKTTSKLANTDEKSTEVVKQGSVGKIHRRPESEQFFRLAKTAKQAILVLSSMEPDAARRKKSRSKPGRLFRQSLTCVFFPNAWHTCSSPFSKNDGSGIHA
jgi:hypothetical protein